VWGSPAKGCGAKALWCESTDFRKDMGYHHIENLYKDQRILLFREVYALEKIHGTSAHVAWRDGTVHFSPGASKAVTFEALFDKEALRAAFDALGHAEVTVYGEAYGGSQQGQKWRYGERLKFVAFEVEIASSALTPAVFLSVPQAADVSKHLGIEFVHYVKVSTDLEALDKERDAPSEQAKRNGVTDGDKPREGVVLRPLIELRDNAGERIMCKHKRPEERETKSPRDIPVDPAKLAVLTAAQDIAEEWVTPRRLEHVLDKLPDAKGAGHTRAVIDAMLEDVLREGAGEIKDSKEARQAICKKAAALFHQKLKADAPGEGA